MPRDDESKGFSRPLPSTNSQTPRTAEQHCVRLRNLVYLRLLEASIRSTRNIMQPQHGIPPADGLADGTSRCHPRAIPPCIVQLSTARLGETPADRRILLQQHSNRNHKNNPLLHQLRISPGFMPDLSTWNDKTLEVSEYVVALRKLHEELRAEIKKAQMAQAEQSNKAQHPNTALEPGNKVWLRRKYIRTTRPSN